MSKDCFNVTRRGQISESEREMLKSFVQIEAKPENILAHEERQIRLRKLTYKLTMELFEKKERETKRLKMRPSTSGAAV